MRRHPLSLALNDAIDMMLMQDILKARAERQRQLAEGNPARVLQDLAEKRGHETDARTYDAAAYCEQPFAVTLDAGGA